MKKLVISLYLFLFLIGHSFADNNDGYLYHCNFSFGISFKAGGDITGSNGLKITLMDGFGDYYSFNYDPNDKDDPLTGLNITLSFPVYYNSFLSTGFFGQTIVAGVFNSSSSGYFGFGVYVEGKYKSFSLRPGIGISNVGISKSIGKVKAAWQGDPGFYTGSEFVRPGESLIATTKLFQEVSGITLNIEFKYNIKPNYFFQAAHIKLGYYFYPDIEANDYEIKIGNKTVKKEKSDPTFTLSPVHHFGLLFGFGL